MSRQFERIYFLYNFNSYSSEHSISGGIEGLAKHLQIPYERICLTTTRTDRDFDAIPDTCDSILVFFIYDQNRTDEIPALRRRCPNAFTVQWGGDTHYTNHKTWKSSVFQSHLYLDPMDDVVFAINSQAPICRKIFWTISQKYLDRIAAYAGPTDKTYDLICMCNPTPERDRFFSQIHAKRKFLTYLREFNTDRIIQLYHETKFALGTTSSCFQDPKYNARSIKGLRDWIAPFCNTLIISDDHPQMFKDFQGILPFYGYNSVDSLVELINMLQDKDLYASYLVKQKAWLTDHTIDKQLIRIVKEL